MILECLVTTWNADGRVNLAPMGPHFADDFDWRQPEGGFFDLRPFEPSRTLDNLQATAAGVLNFTDDVWLLARAALKPDQPEPVTWQPARRVQGQRLADAAHYFEFEVRAIRRDGPRWTCTCQVVAADHRRPLLGWNRAMHAVVEATILATRIDWLPFEHVQQQLRTLAPLVEKTGGPRERAAWEWVEQWIRERETRDSTEPNPARHDREPESR